MHFIQSVLGHSSVSVTEKYYAKFSPDTAAEFVRRTLESGRKQDSLAQVLAQPGATKEGGDAKLLKIKCARQDSNLRPFDSQSLQYLFIYFLYMPQLRVKRP